MSFKDQLSKHEELINKYRELYMNENSKSNNDFDKYKNKPISSQSMVSNNISNLTSNIISNNTTTKNNNIENNLLYNKFNNTDIEKSIEFNSENNHAIGNSNFSINNNTNQNKDVLEVSLERIDNLLSQLNSKSGNFNNINNIQSQNIILKKDVSMKNKDINNNSIIIIDNKNIPNTEIKINKSFNNSINNISNDNNKNTGKFFYNNNNLNLNNIRQKYSQNNNINTSNNFLNTFNKINLNENNNNNVLNNNPFMLTFQQQQQQQKLNQFNNADDILNKLEKIDFNMINQNNNFNLNGNSPLNNNNVNNSIIIQKLKAKYFSNDSYNNNYKKIIAEKDKELLELEKKLNYYKNKLYSSSSDYEKNFLDIKLDDKLNSYTYNSKNNNQTTNSNINVTRTENNNNLLSTSTINKNTSNNNNDANSILNSNNKNNSNSNNTSNNINIYELTKKIKHKIPQNKINEHISNIDMGLSQNNMKESKISQRSNNIGEETINFSLSEDESGLSGYFKFKTSQLEDKGRDKDKDKERDMEDNYNDVLPIINKVSKLKEIKETEEDQKEEKNENNINHSRKESASDIVNNVLDAISNHLIVEDNSEHNSEGNNEEEKYKNILNKFQQEDKDNDILYNQLKNYSINSNKDITNEKPKMIRKNSNEKGKNNKKLVTFEQFLLNENVNE